LQRILRNAVARVCPRELDSEREDLVQTAMLRILERSAGGENSEIRSTSYLVKVAFHTMVDVMRRSNRRRAAGIEEIEGPRSGLAAEVSLPAARPEVSPALRACLAGLVSSRRHAVTLYLQGFTAREAARTLRLEEKAIRNLIFRGIHDLRRCLLEKGVSP
jgi:RNA polymerase sigma factor (sigma-70 family)